MRRIAFIFLLAFFAISLLSCNTAERERVGIRSERFSLFFEGVGDGIALADGEEYREGDLLPVFKRLSDILSVDLCEGDDIIFADLDALSARAERGELLNLSAYLHRMPHLSAYLAANPLVWLSLIEDGSGALYTLPYLSESAYLLPRFNADAV